MLASCPPRELAEIVKAARTFLQRYGEFALPSDDLITAFHGTKSWKPEIQVRAPTIAYSLSRGKPLRDAIAHASGLLDMLCDFANLPLLDRCLFNAQATGVLSPFVSTSPKREVARNFALENGSPGFVLTLQAPESSFFDFNRVRELCHLPDCPQFSWMKELGIPLLLNDPLEIIQVDKVISVREESECIYMKDA